MPSEESVIIEQSELGFFVKVRVLPTEIALQKLNLHEAIKTEPTSQYTDTFLDTKDFSLGKHNNYLRKRESLRDQRLKTVHQQCSENSILGLLMYIENEIKEVSKGYESFLKYKFDRWTTTIDGLDVNYDCISGQFPYEVLSISKQITSTQVYDIIIGLIQIFSFFDIQSTVNIRNIEKDIRAVLSQSSEYFPVSTKFMTMLQLSPFVWAYKQIFKKNDCSINFEVHLEALLKSDKSDPNPHVLKFAKKYYVYCCSRAEVYFANFDYYLKPSSAPTINQFINNQSELKSINDALGDYLKIVGEEDFSVDFGDDF